jgi:PPM family protein phosphatase
VSLALRFAARSDVGLLRDGNEDSLYAGPRVLAVADGMGGHAAGEVASAVAVAALATLDEDDPGGDLLATLRESAGAANEHLREMVSGDPELDGMGTTLTALLFAGSRLGLLHVGDSRCYLLRDGVLTQITKDHTLVQTLVDEGRISEEEASTHPQRNLIARVLDGRDVVDFDLSVREARVGDRYLLCSDGLTGPVGRRETLQEALELPDPQDACDRLVALALRGGGPDNVTVIVADVVESASAGPPSQVVVAGAAASSPQAPPAGTADTAAGRARAAERRDRDSRPAAGAEPRADGDAAGSGDRPGTTAAGGPAGGAARGDGRRRPASRAAVVGVLALVLVGVGAGTGWSYLRSQYYVGVDGEQVAVFRGVSGSVAGVRLSSVDERTDLDRDRLDPLALRRVERGIVARDRAEADMIVERLEERLGPACPDPASPGPDSPDQAPDPAGSPTPDPSLPDQELPAPAASPTATAPLPAPADTVAAATSPSPARLEPAVPCPPETS